jgi:four helix bundle protein
LVAPLIEGFSSLLCFARALFMSHAFPPPSEASGNDPLKRMRVYQLAQDLILECWTDAERLKEDIATAQIAGQLYSAVCSIAANLAEGYSRSSGRDRARIFEYALGSARESMTWYRASVPMLGEGTARARLDSLEEIRRMLMAIIPRERGRLVRSSKS